MGKDDLMLFDSTEGGVSEIKELYRKHNIL